MNTRGYSLYVPELYSALLCSAVGTEGWQHNTDSSSGTAAEVRQEHNSSTARAQEHMRDYSRTTTVQQGTYAILVLLRLSRVLLLCFGFPVLSVTSPDVARYLPLFL